LFLLFSWLLTLLGCGKAHMLDGPGMVNDQPWKAFTVSRSDSYAQYNFWLTVEQQDSRYLLTGECRDDDGTEYFLERGVKLSAADVKYLRELWLGQLQDVIPDTNDENESPIILDAPLVTLILTWKNDSEQQKALPEEISIQMYQRFLPYFQKYAKEKL
jgi:hypothetical protein